MKRSVSEDTLKEYAVEFREFFGESLFTVDDVSAVFGLSRGYACHTLSYARKSGLVKKVCHGNRTRELSGRETAPAFYSFDFSKNEEDVLELFDPIPMEKRALDYQLVGEDAVRKREIDDYNRLGVLPPRPVDRPYDFWEECVFLNHKIPNIKNRKPSSIKASR